MYIPDHSWSNDEDALSQYKRAGYTERMYELADIKRKELRELGASCNNCQSRSINPETSEHCYMFKEQPANKLCYSWREEYNDKTTNVLTEGKS
jgi:hypothetical protein